MDVRQLDRWLRDLLKVVPSVSGPYITEPTMVDILSAELNMMLNEHSERMQNKFVTGQITLMWSRCSDEQWKELQYLGERYQVPWPNPRHAEDVLRLIGGLASEYPDDEDESDIAL